MEGWRGSELRTNVSKDAEAPGGLEIPVHACGHRTQLLAQEQERALPSQTCTPAGPSGVKLLEFTYGQKDKKSFISPQHL